MVVKRKPDGKSYWTPVTLTVRGNAPTLSVFGRMAEPVEGVRRWMEDVVCGSEREEEGFLALRLPSDKGVLV